MVTLKEVSLNSFHSDYFFDEWIEELDKERIKLHNDYESRTDDNKMSEDEFVKYIIRLNDIDHRIQILQDLKKACNESKIVINDLDGGLQMINMYREHPERFEEN